VVDVHDHPVLGPFEPACNRVEDTRVRLVSDEPRSSRGGKTFDAQSLGHDLGHARHRGLVDLATVHLNERPLLGHAQQLGLGAIGAEHEASDLARRIDCLDDRSTRPVAEQDARAGVGVIGEAAENVGPHNQNTTRRTGLDQGFGLGESEQEARASGSQIERSRLVGTDGVLD
jgi:hypothetical protein